MSFPVFDFHCDTLLGSMGPGYDGGISLRSNGMHIDYERGARLPGYAQCFAFFTFPDISRPKGMSVPDLFWRAVSVIQDSIDKNSDLIRQARSAEDIKKNLNEGKISAIFTLEGAASIEYDPAKLQKLYDLGFRVASLSWNEKNCLTGSNVTGGGLTKRGVEFVKEAQRLGILVDVSHISDEAFWDIMDISQAPIVATHSNSRACCQHTRNLTDDMFRAICQTGGVAGLNLFGAFLGENSNLDTACDHILHFLEMDPEGRHISLGGDLDGCDVLPVGFEGVQDYPKLAARLLERGLTEEMVRRIFWTNALEVMELAVRKHAG